MKKKLIKNFKSAESIDVSGGRVYWEKMIYIEGYFCCRRNELRREWTRRMESR